MGGGSRMVKDLPAGPLGCSHEPDRRIGFGRTGLGEEVFADPVFGPVVFNGCGVVGFRQVVGHEVFWRALHVGGTLIVRGL